MQEPQIEEVLAALVQWLRNEVAPVLSSGATCKIIINLGQGSDVRAVVEKHQLIIVK